MVDFGGWSLPVQYGGIISEHEAVRNAAGLFDVSHMGEIVIRGPGSTEFLQRLVTGHVGTLEDNQVLYTLMCHQNGGTVDDLIVYRYNAEHYLLVVNACNTQKDFAWIKEHAPEGLSIENLSDDYAQLAIQGPKAQAILQTLADCPLDDIGFFHFEPNVCVAGQDALVSRTGYTGEDGFEVYVSKDAATAVWDEILRTGTEYGLLPVGLGARDTLRLEAGLPLYGHELSPDITPLEAGLGNFVKLAKGDFIGREALKQQKKQGIPRVRIGFAMIDRGIPRSGYELMKSGQIIGCVTSGSYAPSLKKNMGMAIVETGYVDMEEELTVVVRSKSLLAKRVPLPFYKKRYRK